MGVAEAPKPLTHGRPPESASVERSCQRPEVNRFQRDFDARQFAEIEGRLRYEEPLKAYRKQKIEELDDRVKPDVVSMFEEFEAVLDRVGSAKALHLLAPDLFPLWDGAIAMKCDMRLGKTGTNSARYWKFTERARRQCLELRNARLAP